MENASKALLMAGGVLTTLIIIGLLLLTFNRIGAYRQGNSDSQKSTEIAEFNNGFLKYIDNEKIDGSDLITLANKIIDFNKKNGTLNYINYDQKMTLTVSKIETFRTKYAYNASDSFFNSNTYIIKDRSVRSNVSKRESSLEDKIDTFNGTNKQFLKRLSAIYDTSKSESDNINEIKAELKRISEAEYGSWNGTTYPTIKQIKYYKEYSEFMTSKFKLVEPIYNEGQLQSLSFEFLE